jgi:hypothetical protein
VKFVGDERLLVEEELSEPGLEQACHVQRCDAGVVIVLLDVEGLGGFHLKAVDEKIEITNNSGKSSE